MQIFIYGFKPYRHFNENVTEELVANLPDSPYIAKRVFDVEFNHEMFALELEKYRPELIIGMGQHPGARKLRIERKAVNYFRTDSGIRSEIRKGGSEYLFANQDLPKVSGTTVTYDAGTYVCNFSMYLMCEHAISNGVKFAFLHVPMDIDKNFLQAYLMKITADAKKRYK